MRTQPTSSPTSSARAMRSMWSTRVHRPGGGAHLRPELALLDIGLPVMDGYALAGRLRGTPDWATSSWSPSALWQEADRLHSQEAGFNAYLVKPIDLAQLAALIEK